VADGDPATRVGAQARTRPVPWLVRPIRVLVTAQ